jgi:uncharacterized glyoxalase superfamily protein PhnB
MPAQMDMIGIVVADMGESLAFYRRLGFDLPSEADARPHVEVSLPGGLRLVWDTVETMRSFDPSWEWPTGGGSRMSLAFRLETPKDADRTYAELVSAAYTGHKEPWDAFWGHRYAQILDPDGNCIDLYSPLKHV